MNINEKQGKLQQILRQEVTVAYPANTIYPKTGSLYEAVCMMPMFILATGIEISYPTIDQGRVRVDEMEKCGHDQYWQKGLDLVQE